MKLRQKQWVIACGLYLLTLLMIMVIADFGKLPYAQLEKIPYYDTIGHFILYGIASFLTHQAFNQKYLFISFFSLPLGPFIFTLITIGEEILQIILPYRTFSFIDLTASLLGIQVFYQFSQQRKEGRGRRRD